MILAELAMEAGLPDGVLNIVHGTNVSHDSGTVYKNSSSLIHVCQHHGFSLFTGYCKRYM